MIGTETLTLQVPAMLKNGAKIVIDVSRDYIYNMALQNELKRRQRFHCYTKRKLSLDVQELTLEEKRHYPVQSGIKLGSQPARVSFGDQVGTSAEPCGESSALQSLDSQTQQRLADPYYMQRT